MSKNSNRKLKFGEPEHIISAERARDVIKQKILFKPETDNAHDITQGVIPRNENGKFDKHAFSDTYNLDAADINSAAELLSDKVVTTLEGNGKFTRFTAESLASVDTTILSKMGDPDVSNSLSSLPASNGKTFTSVQMMRAAEKFLSEDEFKSTCNYVVNDARYPKTWIRESELVNPKGVKDMQGYIDVAQTAFNELSDDKKDAIINIYQNSGNTALLDEMTDDKGEPTVGKETNYGSPETVITREQAAHYLSEQLSASGVDNASHVANATIDGISGPSGRFNQYTAEAIASISPEAAAVLSDLGNAQIADDLAAVTDGQPTTNEGIVTTTELLRDIAYVGDSETFQSVVARVSGTAIPDTWELGDATVVPEVLASVDEMRSYTVEQKGINVGQDDLSFASAHEDSREVSQGAVDFSQFEVPELDLSGLEDNSGIEL